MRPLFEIVGRAPEWEANVVRHGLAAWVADELSARQRKVPPDLSRAARSQIAQGARIRRLTLATLDSLAAQRLTPILLKGYGLASRLFTAPLARPSSDVDVLVRPGELPGARRAMEALGATFSPVADADHDEVWQAPGGMVELHFKLFVGFGGVSFDEVSLQRRAVPARLEDRVVRYLAPEDEFLYLAVHAAHHAFLRLSWLVDLAQFLEVGPELDWGVLEMRARDSACLQPLRLTLTVLSETLGVQLPVGARRLRAGRSWRAELGRVLFSPRRLLDASWSADPVRGFLLRWSLVDTPTNGVRFAADALTRIARRRG